MAVINGRIYGVGQALPDSSRLESIDATGVWLTSSMGRLRLELERSTPPRLVRGPERMDNASVSVPDIRETPQVTPRPDALAVLDDVRRRLAEGGAVNATIIGRASDDRPGVRLKSDVQGAGY